MGKLPISAVMVAYHGEATVERALKSCADLVDDLLVVHDGPCNDETIAICQRYTDRVVLGARVGIPEPHRVYTYVQARHDWILQLDQDEFLSDGLRENLGSLIAAPFVHGYTFRWPTWYRGRYTFVYDKIALVNRNFFSLLASPSEHLRPLHRRVKVVRSPLVLEHRPTYDNLTFACFRKKWIPWAKVQAEYYLRDFAKIPKWNYAASDWPRSVRVRVAHPILLGVLGSFVYNFLLGLRYALRTRQLLPLWGGLLMALQSALVYAHVWRRAT